TVREGGVTLGVTISSLISVSLEPPLVLFALHAGSSLLPRLQHEPFGLNVLASDQRDIAVMWSSAPRPPIPPNLLADGAQDGGLRIRDGAAWLLARVESLHAAGDHVVVVGRVLQTQAGDRPPLLHHHRAYGALAPLHAADSPTPSGELL
ncbi:MAG TPA: flavin reductase family protein, partial [Burkholderiaceae bacterium]|nr:flavin reductase family protein [Burkholderiaceae bacterium]